MSVGISLGSMASRNAVRTISVWPAKSSSLPHPFTLGGDAGDDAALVVGGPLSG